MNYFQNITVKWLHDVADIPLLWHWRLKIFEICLPAASSYQQTL
jgi:hypothetical protein